MRQAKLGEGASKCGSDIAERNLRQWVRLEVPASLVGLTGRTVSGISFDQYDGRVWYDRTGIEACTVEAEAPVAPGTDTVWIEDALPAGASPSGTWVWDPAKSVSGTQSHTEPPVAGMHQHYFTGANPGLTPATGEVLFTYILINPCDPPREVMLQWNDGTWEHRAYWGEDLISGGTNGTNSRRRMGDLPQAGAWVRLEVPASQLGLEGRTIEGMAFTLYDRQA